MRRLCAVVLVVAVLAGGCSSTASPRARLLRQMHRMVPNVPDKLLLADADTTCVHAPAEARRELLGDSAASSAGVDGLTVGSAALSRYAARLVRVARDVGYCPKA